MADYPITVRAVKDGVRCRIIKSASAAVDAKLQSASELVKVEELDEIAADSRKESGARRREAKRCELATKLSHCGANSFGIFRWRAHAA